MRAAVDGFVSDAEQFDDLTMLCLEYKGQSGKDQPCKAQTYKELEVEADVTNLPQVQEFIDRELEAADCSMKELMQISVAAEEIFVNIAKYAYGPSKGNAAVRVEIKEDPREAVITFIDSGEPFDPLEKEDPDVTLPAEDREIGGLGIYMVKKNMDDLKYEYKDGKNILTLTKSI